MRVLTVDACRRLLPSDTDLCDHEIELLRDQLTACATAYVEQASRHIGERSPAPVPAAQRPEGPGRDLDLEARSRLAGDPRTAGDPAFRRFLKQLPAAEREALAERAAIREFDGGMDRASAEVITMEDHLRGRANR